MAIIAVDAGTSVIKAVAFSDGGQELCLARANTEVLHPRASWSEQSMESVWAAVVRTIREVASSIQEPVTGICTTAQGDGCWLVDKSGVPTGNALLWNDGRATLEVKNWHTAGVIEHGKSVSGCVTYPGLSNALLRWLQQHDPERIKRSRWVLSCNGWIYSKLTGMVAADLSDASNPFGDVRVRSYAPALFAAYGLTPQAEMFPEIRTGTGLIHELGEDAAQATGLSEGIPVVMAPYDIVSTSYGAGAVEPGQACLILGTTICAEVIVDRVDLDAPGEGTTLALEENFLRAMPTLSGCETLQWASQMLGVADLGALGELARQSPPGAGGLLFLPYLSEAGERSPFLDPCASGSWHNLKLTHRREDMARAVYEGLSFAIRECLQAASGGASELRVCGGGARSDFWCQLIADITSTRVLRPAESEIGARGAFLFGTVATKRFATLREASSAIAIRSDVFVPDPDNAEVYRRSYERFLLTRGAVRPLWSPPRNEERD